MTTLYTAKKYAVPALEKNCVDYLKRHLCADNAFLLLTQARLFDEPQVVIFSTIFNENQAKFRFSSHTFNCSYVVIGLRILL